MPACWDSEIVMIDFTCRQCGAVYHSQEAHVGKQVRCNQCGSLVAIVPPADHGVVQQQPAFPSAGKRRVSQTGGKRRRVYPFAIVVTAIGLAIVSLVFLRHPSVPRQSTSKQPNIAQPVASPNPQTDGNTPTRLPDPRPTEYNSLPTGARIEEDIGTHGHGNLTVDNGTSEDAVVQLSDVGTDQTVRWFFVKAHSSAHKARIPQGIYRLTFTTGLNWVEREDTFSWQPSYYEFERTFEYSEHRDSEGVQYKTISVTLNPVLFGNVRTKTITREEFLRGHRQVALEP